MPLVTERVLTIRDGWLTVDIEYDDITLRVETITITPAIPAGNTVYAAINRGGNPNPWREATFDSTSTVMVESRPFGGGFNSLDQIDGYRASVVYG